MDAAVSVRIEGQKFSWFGRGGARHMAEPAQGMGAMRFSVPTVKRQLR